MNHILVVDDDPAIQRMSSLVLSMEGLTVETASDGSQALDAMKAHMPTVVVLDLQMPVMDGRALFKIMLTWAERPPVIFCSAYSAEKAREELGAEASLDKPFDPDTLVRLVQDLRGKMGTPPASAA